MCFFFIFYFILFRLVNLKFFFYINVLNVCFYNTKLMFVFLDLYFDFKNMFSLIYKQFYVYFFFNYLNTRLFKQPTIWINKNIKYKLGLFRKYKINFTKKKIYQHLITKYLLNFYRLNFYEIFIFYSLKLCNVLTTLGVSVWTRLPRYYSVLNNVFLNKLKIFNFTMTLNAFDLVSFTLFNTFLKYIYWLFTYYNFIFFKNSRYWFRKKIFKNEKKYNSLESISMRLFYLFIYLEFDFRILSFLILSFYIHFIVLNFNKKLNYFLIIRLLNWKFLI